MSSIFEDRGRFLNTCCHNGPVVFSGIILISIPLYNFVRTLVIGLMNGSAHSYDSPAIDSILRVLWHLSPFLLIMGSFVTICLIIRRLQNSQSEQGTRRGPSAGFIAAIGSPEPYARMYGSLYTSVPQAVQPESSSSVPVGVNSEAPIPIIGPPQLVDNIGSEQAIAPKVKKLSRPCTQVIQVRRTCDCLDLVDATYCSCIN